MTDKTNLLGVQFTGQFRSTALKMMLQSKSDMTSTPSSHNVPVECSEVVLTESLNTPINSSTTKDLPKPHEIDAAQDSSSTIQYDANTLNAVLFCLCEYLRMTDFTYCNVSKGQREKRMCKTLV